MGKLIELEIPIGCTVSYLYNSLKKSNLPATLVNLKSFRVIHNSSDPLSYLYNILLEHIKSAKDSKTSFLILDKFDLWASTQENNEENKPDKYKIQKNSGNSYLKSIKLLEGVEDRINKCNINWTYKFLYWIRNSVAHILNEEFGHSLSCFCVYADSFNSRIFYDDLVDSKYNLKEFLTGFSLSDLNLDELKPNKFNPSIIKKVSSSIDFYSLLDSTYGADSVYDNLSKNTKILSLSVPFEVDCEKLELSSITLICGPEGSGKSTLLKSISKYLHNNSIAGGESVTGSVSVFNLEYYELSSQFVGCSESYVKNIFTKASYNKPALVVFDGIELLFERVNIEEERPIPVTVSNTLLNQLYNLEGVKFLACTTGNFNISGLSKAFLSMVTNLIVLSKSLN